MDHQRQLQDAETEAALAVTKLHLGQLGDSNQIRGEAERLERVSRQDKPAHRYLAMLWCAIGENAKAEKHALAAYSWAWADGGGASSSCPV
jgi:serine/threonine protein phosphatase PrpC